MPSQLASSKVIAKAFCHPFDHTIHLCNMSPALLADKQLLIELIKLNGLVLYALPLEDDTDFICSLLNEHGMAYKYLTDESKFNVRNGLTAIIQDPNAAKHVEDNDLVFIAYSLTKNAALISFMKAETILKHFDFFKNEARVS